MGRYRRLTGTTFIINGIKFSNFFVLILHIKIARQRNAIRQTQSVQNHSAIGCYTLLYIHSKNTYVIIWYIIIIILVSYYNVCYFYIKFQKMRFVLCYCNECVLTILTVCDIITVRLNFGLNCRRPPLSISAVENDTVGPLH